MTETLQFRVDKTTPLLPPAVISTIQEAIQDIKALQGLSTLVIRHFLFCSSGADKLFLKAINTLRRSLPLEIVDQIALCYLTNPANLPALDSRAAHTYSLTNSSLRHI